jgi:DNA-binding transcriptional LysR family regulator
MFNETSIRCFLSLAETLNFTKTANQLFITQQAVSKNISRMEESLGFPLFQRSHHAVRLTEGGERCYALFSSFVSEYEKTVGEVRRQYRRSAKTLQIGYQNWLDFGPEPGQALAELQEEYPDLSVAGQRHSPVILKNLLLSKKLDGILLYDRFAPDMTGLHKLELLRSPIVLMVSKDNPLVAPDATFEAFRREPFIYDCFEYETDSDTHERARRDAERFGLSPERIIIMPNRDSAYTAAELGQGIVISTKINRIAYSSILAQYLIGKEESIVGIWRAEDAAPMVEDYFRCLKREYSKRGENG